MARRRKNAYRSPGPVGNTSGMILPQTAVSSGANPNPAVEPETEEEQGWWASWGAVVHTALDVAGMIPVVGIVADAANVAIYTAEGDVANAAISAAAMVPGAGQAATAGKLAAKAAKAGKAAKAAKPATQAAKKAAKRAPQKKPAGLGGGGKKPNGGYVKKKKAEQLKKNKRQGEIREEQVKTELENEGHEVLGSQVTVKTPETHRRIDHLIQDGNTGQVRAIEVKSGNATRNAAQIAKDNAMNNIGGKIVGKNAPPDLQGRTLKIPTEVRK